MVLRDTNPKRKRGFLALVFAHASGWYADTNPKRKRGAAFMNPTIEVIDAEIVAILRQKTEAERLQIAWGMWRMARDMLLNLLRSEHPDWTDQQVREETARRLSGAR
jgi:Rv0078B-related antitoxin